MNASKGRKSITKSVTEDRPPGFEGWNLGCTSQMHRADVAVWVGTRWKGKHKASAMGWIIKRRHSGFPLAVEVTSCYADSAVELQLKACYASIKAVRAAGFTGAIVGIEKREAVNLLVKDHGVPVKLQNVVRKTGMLGRQLDFCGVFKVDRSQLSEALKMIARIGY